MAEEVNCTSNKKPPDATPCCNDGSLSAAIAHVAGFGDGAGWDQWWGVSNSEHIKNAGLVIGYIDPNADARKGKHRWRLDYDDTKGIHLNEDWDNDSNSKRYHVVTNLDAMPLAGMALHADQGDYDGTQAVLLMMVEMTKWHFAQGHAPSVDMQQIIGNKFGNVPDINKSSQKWNAVMNKVLSFEPWNVYDSPWTVYG